MAIYKICDWVPTDKLDYEQLSRNPNAIEFLLKNAMENGDKMYWSALSRNPSAMDLLKSCPWNIDWMEFSKNTNPEAIEMLRQNPDKINWEYVSANPAAIELILENRWKIRWFWFCTNPHPKAIQILKENPHNIHPLAISINSNPEAFAMILENPKQHYDWCAMSANPTAMEFMEKHPDQIRWDWMSSNPKAEHLLKCNQDKLDWKNVSRNPCIFEFDYIRMAEKRIRIILEDLMRTALHPTRIAKLLDLGMDIDDL